MTFRRLIARLHRWGGLVALPVLLCVALSGAALSLTPWLEAASAPTPRDARARALPESVLLARAAEQLPAGDAIASVEWVPGRAQDLTLRSGERWFIDPASGVVLARRRGPTRLERAIGVLHELHVRLLAGPAGRWMVDLASLVALFSSASGLVLWWRGKPLRIRRGARGRRWLRDLHDVTGLYANVAIVALALSGVLLAWEEPLYWLVGAQPEAGPAWPRSASPAASESRGVGAEQWIAAAQRALPGLPVRKLALPAAERSPVAVELGRPDRPGRSTVWLDRWSARVLRVDDFRKAPRTERAHVIDRAVHTGTLVGAPSALAALLGSLALAALAVTGVLTWRQRAPASAARPASRAANEA